MKSLIKISEYKIRKFGKNGTPFTNQAIRNQIKRGDLPGEKIGNAWFVDWGLCEKQSANNAVNKLINKVLRGS